MFRIENMSAEDFEFAVRITDQMDWKMGVEDFQFMKELEPGGCFVLFDNSEKVGIATTVSFGKLGWFGNLIVSKNCRKKGAGSLLVKHSVKYLKSKSVETVGLYAYIDLIPFYRSLGFEYDSEFIFLNGKGFSSTLEADIKRAKKCNIKEIIDYDHSCFGAQRKKLLEPILLDPDNICYVHIEEGRISGYAVAKVYWKMAEVGPLVCSQGRSDVAINLLKATLNKLEGFEVWMCIPQKETAILNMLTQSGFSENFRVARMFLGHPIVGDCIYVAESLERG